MSKETSRYYGFLAELVGPGPNTQVSVRKIENTRRKLGYAPGSSAFLRLLTPLATLAFVQRAQTTARILWTILSLGGEATTSQIWQTYGKKTTHQSISMALCTLKRAGVLVRERAASTTMKRTAARWRVNSPALIAWWRFSAQEPMRRKRP